MHFIQQKEVYYQDENITEITIDAHNQFERNTFFLIPNLGLKITVIGNHTCILADIGAYKTDDIEDREIMNEKSLHDVFKNNTIEIEWSSSYKDSFFNIDNLPQRVRKKCYDLKILELEYLVRGTKIGNIFIQLSVSLKH